MMLFSTVLLFSMKQQVLLHEHLKMHESCQVVRGTQNLNFVHRRDKKRGKNLQNQKLCYFKATLEITLYYHKACSVSTNHMEIPS